MYFMAYALNERYKGRPFILIVLIANLIWIVGPAFGMYASYEMIMSNSYSLFRG